MLPRTPEPEGMHDPASARAYNAHCHRFLRKQGYAAIARRLADAGGVRMALDIGAGCGHLSREIVATIPESKVVAVDLSSQMIGMATDYPQNRERIRYVRADVARLPFENGTFDAAVTFASLHHWAGDVAASLREMLRVVNPGGLMIVMDLKRDPSLLSLSGLAPGGGFRDLFAASVRASYTPDELVALTKNAAAAPWEYFTTSLTVGAFCRAPGEEAS